MKHLASSQFSKVSKTQSATHRAPRAFAPVRFGFSVYAERLSASFRSAMQTESCKGRRVNSAVCVTIYLAMWRDFWQAYPGESASADSFFPSFRPAIAQISQSGESVFYENQNFTQKKFDEPVARQACISTDPARLACAFAAGGSCLHWRGTSVNC